MWCGDVTEAEAAEGERTGEARGPPPSALCVLETVGVGDTDRPAAEALLNNRISCQVWEDCEQDMSVEPNASNAQLKTTSDLVLISLNGLTALLLR